MRPPLRNAWKEWPGGEEIILITWLHQARRKVMKVHPQSDKNNPLTGVFATRSPDRRIPWDCIG